MQDTFSYHWSLLVSWTVVQSEVPSAWYASSRMSEQLQEDLKLSEFVVLNVYGLHSFSLFPQAAGQQRNHLHQRTRNPKSSRHGNIVRALSLTFIHSKVCLEEKSSELSSSIGCLAFLPEAVLGVKCFRLQFLSLGIRPLPHHLRFPLTVVPL